MLCDVANSDYTMYCSLFPDHEGEHEAHYLNGDKVAFTETASELDPDPEIIFID